MRAAMASNLAASVLVKKALKYGEMAEDPADNQDAAQELAIDSE
jgi:hypothetical protein